MDGLMYSGTRKRSRAEFQYGETNDGKNKHNVGRGREAAMPAADSTVYRILCPANLIGSVIGKGGQVIESLRKETGSKIRVADGAPGTDHERVITIYSSPVNNKENENENENAEPVTVCPAQDALLRVHSIIVLDHADHNPNKKQQRESNAENQVINARLLVANSQIGSLIGKGGNNIRKMRSDSGAQIRILPRHQLSASTALAMTSVDELVQISGDTKAVKKALYAVSTFLYKHPPKEQIPDWNYNNNDVLPVHDSQRLLLTLPDILPQGNRNSMFAHTPVVGFGSQYMSGLGGSGSGDRNAWPISNYTRPDLPTVSNFGTSADPKKGPSEEFSIRILCPNDKTGGVIGKGGNTIKNMRKETGASIKIEDAASTESESDKERVIVVSTTEFVHDRVSPTLEAILQLQGKTSSDKEGIVICTRMLVPSKQIGCLLGKGGNIITEMRKKTGADIRIFPKEDRPKCASKKEMELLQIIGEADVARDALIEIVTRLRERVFKDSKHAAHISGRHV